MQKLKIIFSSAILVAGFAVALVPTTSLAKVSIDDAKKENCTNSGGGSRSG